MHGQHLQADLLKAGKVDDAGVQPLAERALGLMSDTASAPRRLLHHVQI